MALTTNQIMNLSLKEFNKLSESDLRAATSTLRSTARKRYERLIESGIYSPAVESLHKSSVGKAAVLPTVRGMDKTQLINEFKRYKQFLSMKTSTVSGTKRSQANIRRETENIVGRKLSESEVVDVWKITGELIDGGIGGVMNYKQVAETVSTIMEEQPQLNDAELKNEARKRLTEIYEREQVASQIYTSQFMQ